jgi:hypothetical protein
MFKKKDIILVLIILLLSLLALAVIALTKEEGGTVVIKVNGEITQSLLLSEDIIVIIGEKTEDYNILEIRDGFVYMTEANCPDELCVKHNRIHYNHESIVCLPHKVVVEIQGGEESEVDMISN